MKQTMNNSEFRHNKMSTVCEHCGTKFVGRKHHRESDIKYLVH